MFLYPSKKSKGMKYTTIAILVCTVTLSLAQTTLLKRQVYDFAAGDILMTKYTITNGSQGRIDWRLDTIVAILNNAGDTFTYVTSSYTFFRDFIFPVNQFEGHKYFHDTITITELDSIAEHVHYCPACSDTLAPNAIFCDALTWTKTIDLPDYHLRSHLVEGRGGPYYHWSSSASMIAVSNELIYYHKADASCGEIFTSISDIDDRHSLKLYPNPADQFIILEGAAFNDQVTIFSMDGLRLFESEYTGHSINIGGLQSGMYFLQLRSNRGREHVLKFIKK